MQVIPKYLSRRTAACVLSVMTGAVLVAASCECTAQIPPESPAAPVPPPGLPAMAPPPPPPPVAGPPPLADAGAAVTVQDTASRFLINPDGDVDGFLTGNGVLVHFPPHMGSRLASMVRPGDKVQVSGWRDAGGSIAAQSITDARSGQQLVDQPPLPDARPLPPELRGVALSRLSAQGQVAHLTTAPRGEPDGVILADGTVIKLTPPIVQQFPALVTIGAQVSAQGYGTRNQYGTALQATAFGAPGNLTQLYDRLPPSP